MVPLSFAGEEWWLTRSGALFRPRGSALLVADLHLEKASFYATHGQFLPPYDSRETLIRLAGTIKETGARRVFCLGDSFHDDAGFERMEPHAAGMLAALVRVTDWVWITGNHDAHTMPARRGSTADEAEDAGIVLRHRARTGEMRPEISGHFHPRFCLTVKQRHIRKPCAVIGSDRDGPNRMIIPAFGALTGGMDAGDPAIIAAMQPALSIDAAVPAQGRLTRFPLWRAEN